MIKRIAQVENRVNAGGSVCAESGRGVASSRAASLAALVPREGAVSPVVNGQHGQPGRRVGLEHGTGAWKRMEPNRKLRFSMRELTE